MTPAPPAPPGPHFRSDWSRRCSDSAWRDLCVAAGNCSGGDAAKLAFLARALDGDPALWGKWRPAVASALPPTAAEAVRWAARTAPAEVIAFRERELAALRERDRVLRASGAVDAWFRGVDPAIRRVALHVNGPLCAEIAERIAFCDPGCVEFFRTGAPLVGELPRSGHGSPEVFPPRLGIAELLCNAVSANRDISNGLRDGAHGEDILRMTRDESVTGRISCPVPFSDACLDGAVIAPRFAVEQLRENGSSKLRLVDDMTKAKINEATRPQERLHHDAVDALFEAARIFQEVAGRAPALWKADIDAAFRRVPIRAEHRRFAWVVFSAAGKVWAAQHAAAPFGATSSVHSWERVGALIAEAARVLLRIAALRYVDDYFGPDHPEVVEQAAVQLAELIQLMLGPGAVAPDKVAWGSPLVILGLEIKVGRPGRDEPAGRPASRIARCCPAPSARAPPPPRRPSGSASSARHSRRAPSRQAARAFPRSCHFRHPAFAAQAPRRSWPGAWPGQRRICSAAWGAPCSGAAPRPPARAGCRGTAPRGRRPLYAQSHRGASKVHEPLVLALHWWREVLAMDLCQARSWADKARPRATLFADASGQPPCVAAVLVTASGIQFTSMRAPASLLAAFERRRDNQIQGLELLAIALGMCTFAGTAAARLCPLHGSSRLRPRPRRGIAGVRFTRLQRQYRRGGLPA